MKNERDYGKFFFQLSFKEAIRQQIITDYKIVTVTVSDYRVNQLMRNKSYSQSEFTRSR